MGPIELWVPLTSSFNKDNVSKWNRKSDGKAASISNTTHFWHTMLTLLTRQMQMHLEKQFSFKNKDAFKMRH